MAFRSNPLALVETRCALCGSGDAELAASGFDFEYSTAPNEFRFLRCLACAHEYLSPRPAASDLSVIYPPNYYAFAGPGNPLVARLRRRWEAGKVRLYRALVGAGPRRLLDVGCGDGRFLSLLREFGAPEWELVGIDFDEAAAARCRALGFEAYAGRIEDLPVAEGTLDAVIMLQLIEHVEDPVAISRAVFRLLRPGGVFVVETPNLGGLDHRWFQGRWWGHYHFPRHWNLFSTASLRRMLEAAGFQIARSEYLISTSSWTISLHNYLLDRGWPAGIVRFFHYQNPLLLAFFVPFDWLRARLGYETSNQRVIARKPGQPA
ncbi:MAG TPA: class I SAM-dependent methyltransferase [Myxococcota bacterium]|jgi:SAM-dependent methyltransferase